MERASGVLLPIFSLPSKYGIGCFSKEAYQFIDRLKAAGQSYSEILRISLFLHLQAIRILSILKRLQEKVC